ncbi:MAG: phosphoribosyltransferase, partial [Candidatus Diapherotrites archaeon]|nr:phosphoribosyltransferase [Candidatus Diapherotrites archaeon]
MTTIIFKNRKHAGKLLAEKITSEQIEDPLILAIPRGGVPVAFEIALKLQQEIRLLITKKLGAPQNPELAIGAVAPDKTVYLNS